jgi:hypothetical protein
MPPQGHFAQPEPLQSMGGDALPPPPGNALPPLPGNALPPPPGDALPPPPGNALPPPPGNALPPPPPSATRLPPPPEAAAAKSVSASNQKRSPPEEDVVSSPTDEQEEENDFEVIQSSKGRPFLHQRSTGKKRWLHRQHSGGAPAYKITKLENGTEVLYGMHYDGTKLSQMELPPPLIQLPKDKDLVPIPAVPASEPHAVPEPSASLPNAALSSEATSAQLAQTQPVPPPNQPVLEQTVVPKASVPVPNEPVPGQPVVPKASVPVPKAVPEEPVVSSVSAAAAAVDAASGSAASASPGVTMLM